MNDLDLSALSTGPVPALASPSDIKARGDQRRTRGRVALAGAAALVVLAGAGTAVALAGGGKPDALVPAAPTPAPSSGSFPGTAPRPPYDVLLQPSDAARVQRGAWRITNVRSARFALLEMCKEGNGPAPTGATAGLVSGGTALTQQVLQYDEPGDAGTAHAKVEHDVRSCPQRPEDSDTGDAYVTSSFLSLTGGATGVEQTYRDCATCRATTSYWAVVTVGPFVGYVSTDRAHLQVWADAMTTRLTSCSHGGGCTADPTGEVPQDALLQAGDAGEITGELWSHSDLREAPESLFAPCATPIGGSGSARELGRDLALPEVQAQVLSVADAARALAALEAAATACSPEDGGATSGSSSRTYDVLEQAAPGVHVVRVGYRDCSDCVEQVSYVVLVARGRLLSLTLVDQRQASHLAEWGAAALARLG